MLIMHTKKYLVLTNHYPSEDDLYKNGFVHRRVKSYEKQNLNIEVFVLRNQYENMHSYTFENIKVNRGNGIHFENFLRENKYEKILIHFVSKPMIEAIKNAAPKTPIIIWIHGFEAEAWHRRWFIFLESREKLENIVRSANRHYKAQIEFMRYLYTTKDLNLSFVHVSRWFKEYVAECDTRVRTQNAHIIPNLIDNDLFTYREKDADKRLKILSIRPFASRKYANDLSVAAVIELSKRPYFNKLEFAFYGDGPLFDETVAPIKEFKNVKIEKGFLKQTEIPEIHKQYGIFLCPTRWDSQGVSMCEAMASGLVPVTTNISAIPEFVEHRKSGLLAEPDNPVDLADKIESLYFNEDLFNRLSKQASESIINKCGKDVVIRKEMELILS